MERVVQVKKKKNISQKIFIALITTLVLTVSAFFYYRHYSNYIVFSTGQKLLKMARKDMEDLVAYVDGRHANLAGFAQDAKIIEGLTTPNFDAKKMKLFFSRNNIKDIFKNIILIKPDGSVLFSLKKSKEFQINLTKPPHKTTNLGLAFEQTMMSLTSNTSSYSYDYILGKPSVYITTPVFYQKRLIGFLAAQMNHNALFEITHNYFELGKTGEVVIAKHVVDGSQVIGELRNRSGAKFNLVESIQEVATTPIQKAVLGEEGIRVTQDYRGTITVNAKIYVPMLDWGLVVKIDLQEVVAPLKPFFYMIVVLLMLAIILGVLWIFLIRKHIIFFLNIFVPKKVVSLLTIRNVISSFFMLVALSGIVFLVFQYKKLQREALQESITLVNAKIKGATTSISEELNQIMFRAQSIADDLSTGRLKKEDLLIRMKRDLRENPSLFGLTIAYAPYKYSSSQKLFAPHVIKDKQQFKTEIIGKLHDYSVQKGEQITQWYAKPMQKGPMWFEPDHDNFDKAIVAKYVVPFYTNRADKEPMGVIVAEYNVDSARIFMQKLIVGQTGYSFLISQSGKFIYHPIGSLVKEEKTIFNVAQQQSNKALFDVSKKILKGKKGQESYIDPVTNKNTWISFNSVPQTNWSLGVVFIESEVDISSDLMRQMLFKIILSVVFLLLVILICIARVHLNNSVSLVRYAVLSSGVLFAALIASIMIVMRTAEQTKTADEVHISSETSLEAYLSEQQRQVALKYQPLITIPTGIYVYSISFPGGEQLKMSCYIWQRYPLDKPDIPRDFRILNAINVEKEKAYYKKDEHFETIGWKVSATIRQFYNYSQYPFDQKQVVISLAPQDMQSKILLTPAMSDYKKTHEEFLGIPKEFKLSEYNIKKTFFSFHTKEKKTTFGLVTNKELTSETNLRFNLILTRDILNAFIVYLMPIFVILFSLYAVFLKVSRVDMAKVSPGRIVGTYSGLLFALIILHSNLRTKYPAGGFLYIEYFFFLAYITILIFIIHALVITRSERMQRLFNKVTLLLKIFFWPVQLVCWLLATISAFY